MTGVRWDIRDIMSQHNAYVDILVRVIHSVNLPDSFPRTLMLGYVIVSLHRLIILSFLFKISARDQAYSSSDREIVSMS